MNWFRSQKKEKNINWQLKVFFSIFVVVSVRLFIPVLWWKTLQRWKVIGEYNIHQKSFGERFECCWHCHLKYKNRLPLSICSREIQVRKKKSEHTYTYTANQTLHWHVDGPPHLSAICGKKRQKKPVKRREQKKKRKIKENNMQKFQ